MRCLSLDLEIHKDDGRIFALAAVDEQTGEALTWRGSRRGSRGWARKLREIDEVGSDCDVLVGHNLIAHDLPHLRAAAPGLRLLRLPVIDTLRLSPLAFPAHPYHHLVKHYKDGGLVRGQRNDPELDARLALKLLDDEREALNRADPDRLVAWHWLTTLSGRRWRKTGRSGFDAFFRTIRGAPRPRKPDAQAAIDRLLAGRVCATHARTATDRPRSYAKTAANARATTDHGWPLAYALAWLSVAGGNSVMPPWVRHQFPEAGALVRRLRDSACISPDCAWCREHHDAAKELKRWFNWDSFRPHPATDDGGSMQRAIVETAMAGRHALGLLPTGAGKSLCYQLPALSRYDKTGELTVVISPLVALMADQVAGMEENGISSCVTVNGLLSMPERADALDRVRLGDAAILLISPEQLRSRSLRRTLEQREIGAWVLDEAHCLSRWGHDFRPDYRYIGRFIRERANPSGDTRGGLQSSRAKVERDNTPPPIMCLTATAKLEVIADIQNYFRRELGTEFVLFNGGSERDNLEFAVIPTEPARKHDDIYQVLMSRLPAEQTGGAIVYCATRRRCEEAAEFLDRKGLAAAHYHAGLPPDTKKRTQQRFKEGELTVIAATNAFGMGIDKQDVRLVLHADIPGSLENYLQEAGRAGRDRQPAHCVLLFTPEDVERQFGISARSRLTRQEIGGILRALRRLDGKGRLGGEVEATAGEILLQDEDQLFERDSATDDTRVKTAVAWLEDAELLSREENLVQVFPSSLRVNSVEEANKRLARRRDLTEDRRQTLLRIVRALIEADPDEGVTTDELMGITRLDSTGVRYALRDLESLGLATDDTVLTAFVHSGIARSSRRRLEETRQLEIALIAAMRETAPDLERGERSRLNLRITSQTLKDEGLESALPERLVRTLRSISQDGRGEDRAEEGSGGSIDMRRTDRENVNITLRRRWEALITTAEVRRQGAGILLDHLLAMLPKGQRGTDLLVETTLGKLRHALSEDIVLKTQGWNIAKLCDRALLWLHEQEVIQLNKGLAVFRPAMTIRLEQFAGGHRRGFATADFEPLQLHYREQVLQIHIMAEFAARGLEAMADAVRLAMDYFSLEREAFLERWLPGRQTELGRETSPETWRTIIESLSPVQRRIVDDKREQENVLVLAGPGSGKTRVLTHRIAYLLRVRRENPRSILALAYNRHAAVEIRRRLTELAGDDARHVTVLTCHGLAMRLVGATFAAMNATTEKEREKSFSKVLCEAAALMRGDGLPPDDADILRGRLLAGFRWILVDEYQDIDGDQYELISALAGRTLNDADHKLTIFAVGDDDQNIYSFAGASVKYIQRFTDDYGAHPAWMTENYRSSAHIIHAANAFIEPAKQRMKTERPIEIDRARRKVPPGGEWEVRDPVGRGRVQVLPAGADDRTQALAAIGEFQRLEALAGPGGWDWSRCAIIARHWRTLEPVRSLCKIKDIPAQMARDYTGYFWRLRETRRLRKWLEERPGGLVDAVELEKWAGAQARDNQWMDVVRQAIGEYRLEAGSAETAVENFTEWLAEWGRDFRRRQTGLLLLTAHRAKGLEFDHVIILDGQWREQGEEPDAWRRLFYVAMTRARQTLALARRTARSPSPPIPAGAVAIGEDRAQTGLRGRPIPELRDHPAVKHRASAALPAPPPEMGQLRDTLSLKDVRIGFAGRYSDGNPIHDAIASLDPGDKILVNADEEPWRIVDPGGRTVGCLARSYRPRGTCLSGQVHAIVTWRREDSDAEYRQTARCDEWEVVVPELVFG